MPTLLKSLCIRRTVARADALILTPAAADFASLDVELLAQLEEELLARGLDHGYRNVVIDLSAVRVGGSGLLNCLARLRLSLTNSEKRLVVCHDGTGLLARVGWDDLMTLQPDLHAALEACAHRADELR